MEAKGRKMLAIGVIIGLCAVAMIGAAYAAFGGTARTYNEDNSATVEYLTLNAADFDAIFTSSDLGMDTYDTDIANTYAFYFVSGSASVNGYVGKVLGSKELTLTNNTQSHMASIDFGAKAGTADFNEGTAFKVFAKVDLKVGETVKDTNYIVLSDEDQFVSLVADDWSTAEDTQATFDNGMSVTILVTLYYGFIADCSIPDSHIGPVGAVNTYVTKAVKSTIAAGPVSILDLDLGFVAKETPAQQPAQP